MILFRTAFFFVRIYYAPTHAVAPNAPAIALRIAIASLMIVSHFVLFIIFAPQTFGVESLTDS